TGTTVGDRTKANPDAIMRTLPKVWSKDWKTGAVAVLLFCLLASARAQTNDGVHVRASGSILAFGIQLDGKIIAGGAFTNLASQTHNHIGRLNPNGTLDSLFNPSLADSVSALLIQPDGQIVAAGLFNIIAGINIVRFKPDGTADNSFHVSANDDVNCL